MTMPDIEELLGAGREPTKAEIEDFMRRSEAAASESFAKFRRDVEAHVAQYTDAGWSLPVATSMAVVHLFDGASSEAAEAIGAYATARLITRARENGWERA